ncbi:MAG: beta strand repeat-containing protein [Planctomycetaceae bacterium]
MTPLARAGMVAATLTAALLPLTARAVAPLSLTGTTYSQSFDGMTNTATSALPAGWAFASGSAPTWTTGTLATTTQFAGTMGSGTLTATSAGGAYLFVNGTAATGSDKAIGFLSSSGFTSPRSILFGLTNNTGGTISALDVGWIYEKYRNGTRQFDWTFYGSTDGTAWTSIAGGVKSYPADATTTPITVASSTVSPLRISGLTVAPGSPYYLRWDYAGLAGSSNAQALGIDGFSLVVAGSSPPVFGTWWAPTPGSGVGGSGTWSPTGATFATTFSATSLGTLASSGTAIFAGTPGTVTVSGSVAAGGLAFAVDGYAVSGGTISLAAGSIVSASAGVTASIGSWLTRDAASSTTFDVAASASLLLTGPITGGAALLKTGSGDLVLAGTATSTGTTTVSAGWLRLGAGGDSGAVGGPVTLTTAEAALVLDRSDDLAFATRVSGSGGLFKEGGNTVTLTGSNSYTGGTTLFAGTLVVGDGGTAGSIAAGSPLDLAAGTALVFDRADDVAFSGTVAGGGAIVQRGGGRLVLSQTAAIGPAFSLVAEAGTISLDRSGAPVAGMLGSGNAVSILGGTLELSGSSGAATRLLGVPIGVDGDGTLAIRRTGAAGDHVTTGFDCPITIGSSGTLGIDFRGAFVGPSLPPVRYRGTASLTGTVTLDGAATLAVTNSAGGTAEVILAGAIVAPPGANLVKAGDQTLTLACGGTLTGPTRVASGTLRLATSAVLASSTVTVAGSATLAVAPQTRVQVLGLDLAAAGLVDVSSGALTIATGATEQGIVSRLLQGRGDGSWNGGGGISSSAAAGSGGSRTVGWLNEGGGGLTVAFAAAGDTNLDWMVDVLDAANFVAGGAFDSGVPAAWIQGDFNYDGVVDVLDSADFLSTGLFDAGPYNATAAAGTITAVPEPAAGVALAGAVVLVSARCCSRIRRTSAIVSG